MQCGTQRRSEVLSGHEYVRLARVRERDSPLLCKSTSRYFCPASRLNSSLCSAAAVGGAEGDDMDRFLRSHANRHIAFVGDSMLRQTFEALMCVLGDARCAIEQRGDTYTYMLSEDPWAPRHAVPPNGTNSGIGNASTEALIRCQHNVTISQDWIMRGPVLMSSTQWEQAIVAPGHVWRAADVIVFGIGAFPNNAQQLRHDVTMLHRLFKRSNRTLIWQEYSGAHFPTASGDFHPKMDPHPIKIPDRIRARLPAPRHDGYRYICQPTDREAFLNGSHGFRLRSALDFFRGMGENTPLVLHDFEETLDAHAQHPDGDMLLKHPQESQPWDCRHFCEPSPVLDSRAIRLVQLLDKVHYLLM